MRATGGQGRGLVALSPSYWDTVPMSSGEWERVPGILRGAIGDNDHVERVAPSVGCAGSGKSTLARHLASTSGLAVVERDGLGKENSPEFHAAIQTVVASDRWIFDGHP